MAKGTRLTRRVSGFALLTVVAGCGAGEQGAAVNRADIEAGQLFYESYCTACHGAAGRGDGALAPDLPVPPADLTRLAAGNGGAFPWSRVMAQVHGYEGRSEIMPEYGTVFEGPKVAWRDEAGVRIETPEVLLQLAAYLEKLQGT